jgi:predicted DCC family thiol-disulfide oxidoreductase YuxK
LDSQNHLILFDGVCNLCNASVNFVLDRDKHKKFKFLALQSEVGTEILKQYGNSENSLESIVLVKDNKLYRNSSAVLHISRHLSGVWPLLYGFMILPVGLRDRVYDFIADHRYRWFGKSDQCRVPTAELRDRFVEQL